MKKFLCGILALMAALCFATACGVLEDSSSAFVGGSDSQSSAMRSGDSSVEDDVDESTEDSVKDEEESYVYPGPY